MVRIILESSCPGHALQALKESLAAYCEKYGDVKVVSIEETEIAEQMEIGGRDEQEVCSQ